MYWMPLEEFHAMAAGGTLPKQQRHVSRALTLSGFGIGIAIHDIPVLELTSMVYS